MFNRMRPDPQTWRAKREILSLSREELRKNAAIMTPYEQQALKQDLNSRTEMYHADIVNGAVSEFKQAIQKVKDAHSKVERTQAKESSRFDLPKLAGEMQAIQFLADMAIKADNNPLSKGPGAYLGVLKLYTGAINSGDINRMRAAGEVIGALPEKMPRDGTGEVRGLFLELARQAKADLTAIRTIPEIAAAAQEEQVAIEILAAAYNELNLSNQAVEGEGLGMFAVGPLAAAARMVKQHPDGRLEFFEEDSVEVTGVLIVDKFGENITVGGE